MLFHHCFLNSARAGDKQKWLSLDTLYVCKQSTSKEDPPNLRQPHTCPIYDAPPCPSVCLSFTDSEQGARVVRLFRMTDEGHSFSAREVASSSVMMSRAMAGKKANRKSQLDFQAVRYEGETEHYVQGGPSC